jgi:hypothetical protein
MHPDTARLHKASVSQQSMTSCSLDLAPSDFYLFGHVKGLLTGESFQAVDRKVDFDEGFSRMDDEARAIH